MRKNANADYDNMELIDLLLKSEFKDLVSELMETDHYTKKGRLNKSSLRRALGGLVDKKMSNQLEKLQQFTEELMGETERKRKEKLVTIEVLDFDDLPRNSLIEIDRDSAQYLVDEGKAKFSIP